MHDIFRFRECIVYAVQDTPVGGIQIHDSVDLNIPWSTAVREGRETMSQHDDVHCVSLICATFKNFQSMNSP